MNESALLYHTHHSLEADDLPFWRDWAEQQGGPILELGCGTGRVMLPLAQAGYEIVGVDRDPEMLTFLSDNAIVRQVGEIDIIQADITTLHLNQRFVLVLMPCNTFSTLPAEGQRATVQRAYEHLRSEGLFIVSMPNPQVLRSLPRRGDSQLETTFPHPHSGHPVEVRSEWKRSKKTVTFFWHYDHVLPDGRVERQTISAHHYLRDKDSILETFRQADMNIEAIYGNYDHTAYDKNSPYLIVVSRS
jgi:SAM-dependent methyltransferase